MRLLLVLVGIALLWGGAQGAYTGATNREPTAIACGDFDPDSVDAHWVRLEGCIPDWEETAYSSILGSKVPSELFIPLRAPGSDPESKTAVVLATQDDEMIALFGALLETEDAQISDDEVMQFAERIAGMSEVRTYDGVIQFGIELDDDDREQLAALGGTLHENFVVLEDGTEPRFWTSVAMLFGGLIALGLGLLLLVGGGKSED